MGLMMAMGSKRFDFKNGFWRNGRFLKACFSGKSWLFLTTCLIGFLIWGNFAFVNAVAMQRQLNPNAMILHQFTWQHFLIAAAVLTLVWYGFLLVSWYLKGKTGGVADPAALGRSAGGTADLSSGPLPHQWARGVDVLGDEEEELMGKAQEVPGLSRVSMSDIRFAVPGVVYPVGDQQGFLQGTVADFLEELKPVFDYAARYRKGLLTFLEHLEALLARYPEIRQSPNWQDVLAHIVELGAEQLPFELRIADVEAFLEDPEAFAARAD